MEKASDPIYQSFCKYLEKDIEFQNLLISKSFGKVEGELELSKVFTTLQAMFEHAGLKKLDDDKLEKILNDCDADKNHKYSIDELKVLFQKVMHMALIKMKNEEVFDNMLADIYDTLDLDDNGSIELEEIEPFIAKYLTMKNIHGPDKTAIENSFNELDKDHNKKLDKKEIAVLVARVTELQFELTKSSLKK